MNFTHIFNSQQGEDLLIYRNFINLYTRNGIFCELGACDGLLYSNTMFFEKYLGFSGILIEPLKEYYDKLIKNRPNNICYNNAISSNKSDIDIFINGAVSGIKQHMTNKFIESWHSKSSIRKVKTKTLRNIFIEKDIKYIDFLSLDVEGGELDVLNTIDWENITIYLICIELDEQNIEKDKKCRQILKDNGFIFKVKMCINEFWLNPNYFRKNILYDKSKIENFTGDMNDNGNHIYLEPHCKPTIEKTINDFENNKMFKTDLLISGKGFSNYCDLVFCRRYIHNFDYNPTNLKENALVFLNLDNFDEFVNILKKYNPKNKFILITHNSDISFTENHFNKIEIYINKIYAINNVYNHPYVNTIPIGFIDKELSRIESIKNERNNEKNILIYMNFNINTNPIKRQRCYNILKNKKWITKESNISKTEFYNKISKSKYIISPEGTGIDCHRIYESIYLNSIPILENNAMDSFYKDLPVMIVKDWGEITKEYLENNYDKYLNKLNKWKIDNPDWLYPNFWIKEIDVNNIVVKSDKFTGNMNNIVSINIPCNTKNNTWINDMFNIGQVRDDDSHNHNSIIQENHQRLKVLESKYDLKDKFVFTFVSHPYTRIINWFKTHQHCEPYCSQTLNEWIHNGCQTHWKIQNKTDWKGENVSPLLQYNFIEGKKEIDFIGKTENYEQDCKQLIKQLNINIKFKKMSGIDDFLNYYITNENKKIIYKMFQKDFDHFDYSEILDKEIIRDNLENVKKNTKVISFSLWGNGVTNGPTTNDYISGAIENAKLAKIHYPDYECWFYIHESSISNIIINKINELDNTRVILKQGDINECKPMCWRFEAITHKNVSVMLSRDTDTRIFKREVDAVNEWLESDNVLHIMRDHPNHRYKIFGGMFGIKKYEGMKDILKIINNYKQNSHRMYDLVILETFIEGIPGEKILAHSTKCIHKFNNEIVKDFPTGYDENYNFVGCYIYENGSRNEPDHVSLINFIK